MRNYTLDPTALGEAPTRECKGCGDLTEYANSFGVPCCADCFSGTEHISKAISDFHAALPKDLQDSFNLTDAFFDAGQGVAYFGGKYTLAKWEDSLVSEHLVTGTIAEVVAWCVTNREVLV